MLVCTVLRTVDPAVMGVDIEVPLNVLSKGPSTVLALLLLSEAGPISFPVAEMSGFKQP